MSRGRGGRGGSEVEEKEGGDGAGGVAHAVAVSDEFADGRALDEIELGLHLIPN